MAKASVPKMRWWRGTGQHEWATRCARGVDGSSEDGEPSTSSICTKARCRSGADVTEAGKVGLLRGCYGSVLAVLAVGMAADEGGPADEAVFVAAVARRRSSSNSAGVATPPPPMTSPWNHASGISCHAPTTTPGATTRLA